MFGHKKENSPAGDKVGLYVHIPFCRSKCDYCDFYSLAGQENRMDDCQRALLAHIRETGELTGHPPADTVFFGGGTPSFYGEKRLRELLKALKKSFLLEKDAEITLEANPDSIDLKSLKKLRRAGFNRISIGMQSACPRELAEIHRPHTAEQTDEAVAVARKAGFDNLSLDLIYGLPGQTFDSWAKTVEHALSLEPRHLSCYALKLEEGTPLFRRAQTGQLTLPDDDMLADLYLWTVDRLAAAGLEQYEISNFARPGFISLHNLRYWQVRPYLGFGPGAHSDFGGRRYSFVQDLEGYINGVLNGGALIDSQDTIPTEERRSEYLMLGLRTAHGVEEWEYRGTYHMNFAPLEEELQRFRAHGWTEKTPEGRWRLTPKGFLVSNQLIGSLLERQERTDLSELLPRAKARYGGGTL